MNESFDNLSVDIETLPKLSPTDFKPIERTYLKVSIISNSLFFITLMTVGICMILFNDEFSQDLITYGITIGSGLLLWFLNIAYLNKAFPKKQYALREKDIIYTKGLLWSSRTSIPFNRIQHVEIKQGPFERFFKLNSLKIFTAGGQTSDLVIPGLNEQKALQLKEFILGKTALDE